MKLKKGNNKILAEIDYERNKGDEKKGEIYF